MAQDIANIICDNTRLFGAFKKSTPDGAPISRIFKREVLPHAPEPWIDHEKTKVGYEIPFNRHFYVFKPPRPLAQIDAELKGVTERILTIIGG